MNKNLSEIERQIKKEYPNVISITKVHDFNIGICNEIDKEIREEI